MYRPAHHRTTPWRTALVRASIGALLILSMTALSAGAQTLTEDPIEDPGGTVTDTVESVGEAVDEVGSTGNGATESVGDAAGDAAGQAGGTAGSAADQVGDGGSGAQGSAGGTNPGVDDAVDQVGDAVDQVGGAVEDTADEVADAVSDAAGAVTDRGLDRNDMTGRGGIRVRQRDGHKLPWGGGWPAPTGATADDAFPASLSSRRGSGATATASASGEALGLGAIHGVPGDSAFPDQVLPAAPMDLLATILLMGLVAAGFGAGLLARRSGVPAILRHSPVMVHLWRDETQDRANAGRGAA